MVELLMTILIEMLGGRAKPSQTRNGEISFVGPRTERSADGTVVTGNAGIRLRAPLAGMKAMKSPRAHGFGTALWKLLT